MDPNLGAMADCTHLYIPYVPRQQPDPLRAAALPPFPSNQAKLFHPNSMSAKADLVLSNLAKTAMPA
jgi:hypothetical protein